MNTWKSSPLLSPIGLIGERFVRYQDFILARWKSSDLFHSTVSSLDIYIKIYFYPETRYYFLSWTFHCYALDFLSPFPRGSKKLSRLIKSIPPSLLYPRDKENRIIVWNYNLMAIYYSLVFSFTIIKENFLIHWEAKEKRKKGRKKEKFVRILLLLLLFLFFPLILSFTLKLLPLWAVDR